jgi:c-di-GMP-binding flagellar brake protein YcgR
MADGRLIKCRIVDIATSGMAMVSPVQRPEGGQMQISFELPDNSGRIDVVASLVRQKKLNGEFFWGVKFLKADARSTLNIANYVRDQIRMDKARKGAAGVKVRGAPPAKGTDKDRELSSLYRRAMKSLFGGKPKKKR